MFETEIMSSAQKIWILVKIKPRTETQDQYEPKNLST